MRRILSLISPCHPKARLTTFTQGCASDNGLNQIQAIWRCGCNSPDAGTGLLPNNRVDGTLGWRSIFLPQPKDAMTLASVPTIIEGPLADALIAALEHASEPLAATKLAQIIPLPYKKQKSRFESILQELVAQGRVHGFPPFRSRQPRYWTRDQDHYARVLILNLLVEKGPSRPA